MRLINQFKTKIKEGSVIRFNLADAFRTSVYAVVLSIEDNIDLKRKFLLLEFKLNKKHVKERLYIETLFNILCLDKEKSSYYYDDISNQFICKIYTSAYKVATIGLYENGDRMLIASI